MKIRVKEFKTSGRRLGSSFNCTTCATTRRLLPWQRRCNDEMRTYWSVV